MNEQQAKAFGAQQGAAGKKLPPQGDTPAVIYKAMVGGHASTKKS